MNEFGEHVRIGAHEFLFIEPDEVHGIFRGVCEDDVGEAFRQFMYAHADRIDRRLFVLMDLTKFEWISPTSRRDIVAVNRPFPVRCGAFVGTGFSSRVLVNMVMKAGRVLAPKYFDFHYEFFATSAEAVVWFSELRKKNHFHAKTPPQSKSG